MAHSGEQLITLDELNYLSELKGGIYLTALIVTARELKISVVEVLEMIHAREDNQEHTSHYVAASEILKPHVDYFKIAWDKT